MIVQLPFLTAVALAGAAYVTGQTVVNRVGLLKRYETPVPLLGGLLFALAILLLRAAGLVIEVPTSGSSLDFLFGLLTTNMGLHITPQVLRKGLPLFLVFFTLAVVLFFLQLLVALAPAALGSEPALATALLAGPISLIGAPFSLNPPGQMALLAPVFASVSAQAGPLAQGVAMVGVLLVLPLGTILAHRLDRRAGEESPKSAPSEQETGLKLMQVGQRETYLIVLILLLTAAAFGIQSVLLELFPTLQQDHMPVIVLAYLLGATFRLAFSALWGKKQFYDKTLTHLLLGPTMSIVLAYAVMSTPLHRLGLLSLPQLLAALLAIAGSFTLAWLAFPLFARFTDRYYAAVIATAFFAITTGWGPIGMGFLRRFTRAEGPVKPMPVIMPLNAFYVFPWLVVLLGRLLL